MSVDTCVHGATTSVYPCPRALFTFVGRISASREGLDVAVFDEAIALELLLRRKMRLCDSLVGGRKLTEKVNKACPRDILSVTVAYGQSIDEKTFAKIYSESEPLTDVSHDIEGRCIQLWKTRHFGLVGSVLELEGNLKIILGNRIHNPLNPKQNPNELMGCLEKALPFFICNKNVYVEL